MLERLSNTINSVTVATSAASSEEIKYGPYAGGMVFIPSGSSITLLTWHVAEKPGGTYLPAQDEDSAAVTQTVAATKAYPIPAALFGTRAIKAVGNVAGTMAVSVVG